MNKNNERVRVRGEREREYEHDRYDMDCFKQSVEPFKLIESNNK